MSKYIDVEKLAVLINDYLELPTLNTDYQAGIQKVLKMINAYPAADVQEVKHGKWIEPVPGDGFPYCSNCKNIALDRGPFLNPKLMDWHLAPYCPHCGAKMDGKE